MADWTREDIARLLALLERIAAAFEGQSGAPPIGGTPSYPPAWRGKVTRTAVSRLVSDPARAIDASAVRRVACRQRRRPMGQLPKEVLWLRGQSGVGS